VRQLRSTPGVGVLCAYVGLTLLVAAWLWLGRILDREQSDEDRPSRTRKLVIALACWAAPLCVAPPLFSRDVYSYLVQGAMVVRGLDVYSLGPSALGGPFLADIPSVWRDTPAPYGPVFMQLAAAVARLSGSDVTLGVLGMRAVALAGVGLLAVWLPRLASRCGMDPARALWLGALNPLVLTHLVAGVHNDALMLGLLTWGISLVLGRRPMLGVAIVTVAALVKAPAVLALPVCAAVWASHRAGQPRRFIRAASGTAAVALGVTSGLTVITGAGYGWVSAIRTPARVHNGLSVTTDLGIMLSRIDGSIGSIAVPAARIAGVVAAAVICLVLYLRGRRASPVYTLGLGLIVVVLLGPAVHIWYLLWGIIPIAAAAPGWRIRQWTAWGSAGLALVLLPQGDDPTFMGLGLAALGVALATGGLLAASRWHWVRTDLTAAQPVEDGLT
jgi:hypothetical protein